MKKAYLVVILMIGAALAATNAQAQADPLASGAIQPLDFTWTPKINSLTSTWLWWTDKPRLSFTLTPSYGTLQQFSTTTGSVAGTYLGVYGLDLKAKYRIGFLPQLFLAADLGYQSLPSAPSGPATVTYSYPNTITTPAPLMPASSAVDAYAGAGLWFDLWSFSLRAWFLVGG